MSEIIEEEPIVKIKKPRTDKQKAALIKARETREKNKLVRDTEKAAIQKEAKKIVKSKTRSRKTIPITVVSTDYDTVSDSDSQSDSDSSSVESLPPPPVKTRRSKSRSSHRRRLRREATTEPDPIQAPVPKQYLSFF